MICTGLGGPQRALDSHRECTAAGGMQRPAGVVRATRSFSPGVELRGHRLSFRGSGLHGQRPLERVVTGQAVSQPPPYQPASRSCIRVERGSAAHSVTHLRSPMTARRCPKDSRAGGQL